MWRYFWCVLWLMVTCSALARDLNRQNYLIGERASGMGGAIVSLGGDPESVYYNPAGLANILRQGLSLSASAYQITFENYDNIMNIPLDSGGRLTADMESKVFGTFPQSIVYVLPLGSTDVGIGLFHVLSLSFLIPDYDKMQGSISQPTEGYAFQMNGSFFLEERTYWFGPSYAMAIGSRLRLGISLFGLAHQVERRINLGVKLSVLQDQNQINIYTAASNETEGFGITCLFQVGAQLQLDERWTVGLNIRSPTLGSIYSNVRMLNLSSLYSEDPYGNPTVNAQNPGYVDRIENKDVRMDYRLPMMIAAGASYQIPDVLAVGLDLSIHLPLEKYNLFSGKKVYPQDPQGNSILVDSRALDPTEDHVARWVINVNAGAEYNLTVAWRVRLGFFTDFSVVDNDFFSQSANNRTKAFGNPNLTRLGTSLGVGRIGERTTTSINVIYVCGWGDTWGLNEDFGYDPNRISVVAHTITLVVAGSANF